MSEGQRSSLEKPGAYDVYRAAKAFAEAYERYSIRPDLHMRRANCLATLGALEAAVDIAVSRETAELERKLDGTTEEPPF